MVSGCQSKRDDIYPTIPKHKCCTDVPDYRMRINGALGELAAHLNHDLICLERIGWREGFAGRIQKGVWKLGLVGGRGGVMAATSACVNACACACLCVFKKRWNEALQEPWPLGGGKGTIECSPSSTHNAHLHLPPPNYFLNSLKRVDITEENWLP